MFVLCETPNAADLAAIKKTAAAANNATADSGSFSGAALNPELLKKLENLVIDYKPGQPRTIIKKVEIGCPVQLKNHVERFFENVSSILSGAEVGFDCAIIPTEINYHEERTFYAGSGKTVVVIATRTYFVIPKQPLTDLEMVLQLEHSLSSMARKNFGYKAPNALESEPLKTFEMLCDRLNVFVEWLETHKTPFKKSKEITKDDIVYVRDACDLLGISLKRYDNIQEEIFKGKDELECRLFQVELQQKELQSLIDEKEQIITKEVIKQNLEYQKKCFDDATQKLKDILSGSLRKLRSLNASPELQEEMQEHFQEQLEAFENHDFEQ